MAGGLRITKGNLVRSALPLGWPESPKCCQTKALRSGGGVALKGVSVRARRLMHESLFTADVLRVSRMAG